MIRQSEIDAFCDEVAALLKAERERQHLSMTEVAQRAGISQQMVSYLERGIRRPSLGIVLRLTIGVNADLADIVSRAKAAVSGKR